MIGWLLTDKVFCSPGTAAERGWRCLRRSVERHDGPQTDYRYTKVALETIMSFDRTSTPPPWLIHEYLIRALMQYEVLEVALDHTLSMTRWIPLFCTVLAVAAGRALNVEI